VANSQDESSSQHPDLLAAVVLHTLVSEARDGMSTAAIAVACDRDPDAECDIDEIVAALEILLDDGLAECEATPRHKPNVAGRPGVAQELDTARKPNTDTKLDATQVPDIPPRAVYRPTHAAIRANELSF
jgi:hypothetical protein